MSTLTYHIYTSPFMLLALLVQAASQMQKSFLHLLLWLAVLWLYVGVSVYGYQGETYAAWAPAVLAVLGLLVGAVFNLVSVAGFLSRKRKRVHA